MNDPLKYRTPAELESIALASIRRLWLLRERWGYRDLIRAWCVDLRGARKHINANAHGR